MNADEKSTAKLISMAMHQTLDEIDQLQSGEAHDLLTASTKLDALRHLSNAYQDVMEASIR